MQHEPDNKYPLVSVICFCRNGAKTIRRCIDAILAQDYPNIEVIVQDGTSTDGTLEILHGYGDKIGLVSEPDNGPNDAMFRGLCRMKGEFFVFSLADEAMLSHAVSWGVENLKKHPKAAAIYGDYYVTDINGNITRVVKPIQWDFESYFCSETTPSLCASFFRKSCYDKIGFQEYTASDEFDLWINLGARFPIHYVPCRQPAAKYAVYPGELSLQKDHQIKRLNSRKRAIQKLCGDPNTPEPIRLMQDRALASLVVWNVANLCKAGAWDQVKELTPEAFKVGPNTEKLQYLAELIYNHIIELCQKGDLKEALEFLDLLKNSNVVGKKLDYQREQILHKLAKNRSRYKTQKEICMDQKNIPIKDRQFTSLINTKSPADLVAQETKFSFVMIVLNGMPFIEYSLKAVYEFAHEIIIVEGAVKDCMFAANPDGSSKDGTVEFIKSFPDPDNKIRLIRGKWSEKCEMQNEALKYVTGNYVWLIDSDEVYKKEHLEKTKEILKNDPAITQVNFIPDSFWKGLDYIFVSSKFFEYPTHYRRLFKYVKGAVFTTHRPPTMVWPGSNRTTEQMNLLDGSKTRQMGIIFYHYSYVLDKQVRQKIELYHRYGWGKSWNIDLAEWYNQCFLRWQPWNRHQIDNKYPIWTGDKNSHTMPFSGTHPRTMMEYIHKDAISSGSSSAMQYVTGAINEIKDTFPNQQINAIETGTIRSFYEKHFSTFYIADTLSSKDNLISVDISTDSIRISKQICHNFTNIKYVKSDSIEYLKKLKDVKFHFVFLDSVNDKEFIFEEFKLIIPMMVEGSILMVDDAGITADSYEIDRSVSAQKGHKVLQFLLSCGIQPKVLQTTQGHGTQLKIVMNRENLTKIKNHLNIVGYPQSRSSSFSKSVIAAENTSIDDNSINNVLWVRTDSIGDNVLASSMLPHIRAKYKDAKITVLCQRYIAELYDSCPFVDDTIVFNRKRALKDQQYREEIIKQLHILKPDISLNSVYSREPITDLFALNCGAGQRIALDGNLCNTTAEIKHKCDQFYTMLLPSDGEQKPELQRHRDFLQGIGIEATSLKPMVWITAEDEEFAEKFFRENQLNQKNTVALFPTAQHHQKNYEKYEYILKNLEGFDFIILGDSEAQAYADKIQKSIPNRCYNLAGKTTIRQMAAIIRNCCVYLGSDSAGAHIACAVDTPNIVILGGGHFGRFIPYSPLTSTVCMPLDCYGCSWGTCNYQRPFCVKDIAPEVIIKAFQQTFAKSSEKYKIFVHDDSILKPHLHQHCRKILDRFLEMDKVEIIPVKSPPSEIQNNLLTDGHYTKIVPMSEGIALETFRNEEFLKGLDVELDGPYRPTVWVTQADREVAEQLLNRRGIKEPIVIIPFAQLDIRNWPVKNWAKLISMYPDVPVIICGIEKDKPAAEKIISLANHPNIHNLCGLTTARQFAALIAKSRLSISSESGAAHIAAAANRPHVVLIGGGHFGRFMPYSSQTKLVYNKMDCYNCNWQCKYGQDISCIVTISVDMVERAVNEVFGTIRPVPVFDNSKVIIQAKKDIADKSDFLVSAIVSTYNSEKFIRGCLDDLIDQSLFKKGQLEIVVVNSGSQQNEEAIFKEFQQRYDNIKYIKTEQREGIYAAWNRTVKVARGTFLTNANTDDRHREDALEIMSEMLLANPDVALVYGDQIYTDTPNGTFANHHAIEMAKRPEYSQERLLFGCCVGSQPMWRKSLHNEFGYFDDTLTCAGDWNFWLRISSKYKFKHIPEFLGLYYHNEEGIEHGKKIHSLYERYKVGRRYGNPYISVIPLYTSKDNPLVSVIMAAYNAAEHIAEAIESVLIQNYRNFELIVVDDGSTDNTSDIVAGFKDDKIRCFYKENAGPASARNLGITKSQGLFLIHLDSDDMITPDFITKHLQEFERHPGADLVYCDDCLIEENSKPIRVIERPEYKDRRLLIRDLFHCGFPAVPFRTCIRRSVFDKIGFFDEGLLIAEDYDMMRRFVKHGLKIHHLKGALYLRRMTSGSLSRNYSTQKAKCHFDVIKRYIDTFTNDELFPDVAWDQIAPEMRQLHAKCLTAGTYLAIGQEYVKTNAPEYSRIAFDLACSELNGCVKVDPENQDLRQLLQKSKLIRAKYTEAPQQVVS